MWLKPNSKGFNYGYIIIKRESCYGHRHTGVGGKNKIIMGGQVLDYEAKNILNEGVIKGTVEEAQFYGATFEAAVDRISTKFNLKPVEAEEAVGKYWK